MSYGIGLKEYDNFAEKIARKLKISKARVAAALDEIVREDVKRVAINNKGDNNIEQR